MALRTPVAQERPEAEGLVPRLVRGDRNASDEAYRTYHAAVRGLARRLLGEMDRREREILAQGDTLSARLDSSRVEFAGRRAALFDDPLIDLAGEQAQRQADHARGVTQHPLDRQMGLAGARAADKNDQAALGHGHVLEYSG